MSRALSRAPRQPAWRGRLSIALVLCCAALPAMATTYRLLTPSQLLLAADLVFYGTVSDVVTEDRAGEDWTVVTFRLDELLKGFGYDPAVGPPAGDGSDEQPGQLDPAEVAPESVKLAFLGGTTAGADPLVSGAPSWRIDESFLVAAYQGESLASPLVGFRQGLWRLTDEGLVDLDDMWLGVAEDGAPVRAETGATTSQVVRAVQGVVAGTVTPGAPSEGGGQPGGDVAGAAAGQAAGEPSSEEDTEPAGQPVPDQNQPQLAAPGSEQAQLGQEGVMPLAVDYDVDDSGGPLLLSDKVALAAAAWTAAVEGAVDLDIGPVPGSRNTLRYGDEALLGPDTLSLTTVAPDGTVTALLSPTAGELAQTAIMHELGVIMGLGVGGDGVMATAVSSRLDAPTEADVAELAARSRFEPADLTRDGRVDFYDLLAVAEAFGATGVNLAGDLDDNGTIDEADIELLRQRYQFGRPEQTAPEAGD